MFKRAYIEITNICNLNCTFCHGTKRSKRFMSPEEFRTIASELRPYTDYIYLHVMGEPLLHPQLSEILAIASDMGFHINITTNGTLLDKCADLLLSYPSIRKVSVSLHSFEGNKTISGQADTALTPYLESVWSFASRAPFIVALRLWNEGDAGLNTCNSKIIDFLSKKTGLDVLSLPCDVINGRKLRDRLYLESADRFEWPDLSAPSADTTFCYGLSSQIAVLVDGTVVPCCLDSEGTIALGNLLCAENAADTSASSDSSSSPDSSLSLEDGSVSSASRLSHILSSQRAAALREGFAARCPSEELCRHCDYASRF